MSDRPSFATPNGTPTLSAPARSRRRPVLVLGTIDCQHPGAPHFTITVDEDVAVPCVLAQGDLDGLRAFDGTRAIVSGVGVWSLLGELLRIEVDGIADGTGESPGWSRVPRMPQETSDLPPEVRSPISRGYEAIIGAIPADGPEDAEVMDVLKRSS